MFTVTIHSFTKNPREAIRSLKWKEADEVFYQSLDFTKKLLTLTVESDKVTGSFAQNLSLTEYKAINGWLTSLIKNLNGRINDCNSRLGYLEDGTPAYIVTNWEEWEEFLMIAKLRSLEGKKVKVLNAEGNMLEEGLLAGYTKNETSRFMNITSCSIITLFGERNVAGEKLKIEAVYE